MATAVAQATPPAPPRKEARWIPTILVLLVLLVVTMGGWVVVGAMGEQVVAPSGEGETFTFEDVEFRAPSGWTLESELPEVSPGSGAPGLQFVRGDIRVLVVAYPGSSDPVSTLERYVNDVVAPQAVDAQASEITAIRGELGRGARQAYIGSFQGANVNLEGDVTAFVSPGGVGLVVDGWAPEGQYLRARDQVHAISETARAP